MSTLNTETKILLVVFTGLILVYLLYNGSSEGFDTNANVNSNTKMDTNTISHTQFMPQNMDAIVNPYPDAESIGSVSQESHNSHLPNAPFSMPKEDMIKYFPKNDYAPPESDWLKNKFDNKGRSNEDYKRSSYCSAKRGQLGPSEWTKYFDNNNDVIGDSQTGDNDRFLPIDETNGGFAVFKSQEVNCGNNQNCNPEDLFDVDKYLPQEVNDDWFKVQPEPISIKNRHLINVSQPIGIGLIGQSIKNQSYDLRGSPTVPRFITGPFLQSVIEGDSNFKPLY